MAEEMKSVEAGAKTPARRRSPFDKDALSLLADAESVARGAQRPECVAPLKEREISPAFVQTLLTDTLGCQAKLATVLSVHGSRAGDTAYRIDPAPEQPAHERRNQDSEKDSGPDACGDFAPFNREARA